MSKVKFEDLLSAGVHFGHLRRKWNPAMAPYIFEEKKGIHIIDLNKTIAHLDQATAALKQIAKSGKKILFVATKKQAKDILSSRMSDLNMPFVTERWTGGMLTNFQTTRKSIRKMTSIDKMQTDGTWETLNKRERLFKTRQRQKLEKNFGSISDMTRQPAAIFIVDIIKEHIALKEATRLKIPTFAIVDTNSNPKTVDFPIPANDDAAKSITIILDSVCAGVKEGLEERKIAKEASDKNDAKQQKNDTADQAATEAVKADSATKEDSVEIDQEVVEAADAAVQETEVAVEEVAAKKTVTKKPTAKKAAAKKPAAKKAAAKKPAAKKVATKKPAAKKAAAKKTVKATADESK